MCEVRYLLTLNDGAFGGFVVFVPLAKHLEHVS